MTAVWLRADSVYIGIYICVYNLFPMYTEGRHSLHRKGQCWNRQPQPVSVADTQKAEMSLRAIMACRVTSKSSVRTHVWHFWHLA